MSVSSDEINFLVYRYLQESGFAHAAFTFAHESLVARSAVADAEVPPGALISFLQKGLQYVEIETHLQEDGAERPCDEPFHLLAPHACRLRALGKGASTDAAGTEGGASAAATDAPASAVAVLSSHTAEAFALAWSPTAKGAVLASGAGDGTARVWRVPPSGSVVSSDACTILRHSAAATAAGTDARSRKDRTSDVSCLEWSPEGGRLATGCVDGRGRIWSASSSASAPPPVADVTTTSLVLQHTLVAHTGQVNAARWSPGGSFVATASVDKTAIVWDVNTGEPRHVLAHHSAPVLDCDWAQGSLPSSSSGAGAGASGALPSDASFAALATASTDKLVLVCSVVGGGGVGATPSRTFVGHTDEVNTVRWAPRSSSLLASGSDDSTVRLWSMGGDGAPPAGCVATLTGHKKSVYLVRWCPTSGSDDRGGGAQMSLASASFDGTIRVWDAAMGRSRLTLGSGFHTGMVYGLAWSPCGTFLATTAADKRVAVWSAADGALVRTFTGPAAGFDVAFSPEGDKVAACFATGAVVVVDLRSV